LPLLNGSDDEVDELDDEVAMISNKRGVVNSTNPMKKNELISIDDIKVTFKGETIK
jgi:hypothetical protein